MRFLVVFLIFSTGSLLSACSDPGDAHLPQRGTDSSCFEPIQNLGPSFLNRSISVAYKDKRPSEVARDLRKTHNLPISYIDQGGKQLITLNIKEASVRSLLQSLLARMPGTVCRVMAGHVVIYPDRPEFKALVAGVDVIDKPRAIAAREYLEIASEQVDYFKDIDVLLGGIMESPMFEDQVSLSRKARVIDHLVQILGTNQSVFFVIDRAPVGGLYFSLGSV